MQYGMGPTTVHVAYGLLVHSPLCRVFITGSDRSAQMCTERAGVILHPRRNNASSTIEGKRGYHDTCLLFRGSSLEELHT